MSYLNITSVVISLCALLVAIIGHEIMHGLAALYYGDDTAKVAKRLSINPIKHIDLVGSIILPISLVLLHAPFMFGWAKPVPVNIREVIKNGGYNAAIIVSLAGIIYNFLLAICAYLLLKSGIIFKYDIEVVYYFLINLIIINIILGFFNLLPIPPLDGSQALGYLSLKFNNDTIPIFFNKIERFGIFILIGILLIPPVAKIILLPPFLISKFLLKGIM
ncbi:site-2 protease family protein [Helicobacter sp. MIT 99-5507]|uniref:site-2 protease family protein n=1 Tax=Helicobacter sp. MIT 99-5507 TaxID=152489 RepID=UPI000E1F296D|nr:site-2 protease family protein [Helicobacter sp. MIT 99-5507]RDU56690.1 site-2 protease family protein [Helicobacter sp. MIT 99-5507]